MLTPDAILERTQWDVSWVPPDTRVVDRPELLFLRCDRPVGYLNSCLRIRAEGALLRALVEELSVAHQGVSSTVQVNPQCRSEVLESSLVGAGYAPGPRHHGMSVAVEAYDRSPPEDLEVRAVRDAQGLSDWDRVHSAAFGRPVIRDPDELALELSRSKPGHRVQRFVARDRASGSPLAACGFTAFDDLGFGLFWGGGTVPEGRGRGAYTALVRARVDLARARGLVRVGLYARVETSAPIVARQGFECHGLMTYWERPVPMEFSRP